MDRRLNLTIEILKKEGTLRSSALVRRLMAEGPMARDTAFKIIKEGVRTRKIIEEKTTKGNAIAHYYTIYSEIAKNEKLLLEQIEKFLNDFDSRYSIFEEKFSSLSIKQKTEGVERYSLFLTFLNLSTRSLWEGYQKKRAWKTLVDELNSRKISFNKLVKSCPKKEQIIITNHVLEGKLLYLDDAKGFLDEFLDKIK